MNEKVLKKELIDATKINQRPETKRKNSPLC